MDKPTETKSEPLIQNEPSLKKSVYLNYNHGIDSPKVNIIVGAINTLISNGYEEVTFLINSEH